MSLFTTFNGFQAGGYFANPVNFDGTNDWLNRGAALTGVSNSKEFEVSFSYKSSVGGTQAVYSASDDGFSAQFKVRITGGRISIIGLNASGTTILNGSMDNTNVLNDDNWHNILISVDMTNESGSLVNIDDSDEPMTYSTFTNDTIDFSSTECLVGAAEEGGGATIGEKLNGDLSDLKITFGTSRDLTDEAVRRLFFDANGKPVDQGTNSSSILYFSKRFEETPSDFATNKGTGGGMTENGTLTASTTSPSD